jgi:hypothetical protein
VLRNCRLPAVLVECGFLINPIEAQLALTPAYREQVAEQIAAGIIEQRQFSFPLLLLISSILGMLFGLLMLFATGTASSQTSSSAIEQIAPSSRS